MAKASDNVFPRVIHGMNTADQAAPTDSSWRVYAKANGIFARSSNSIVGPFSTGAGAGVATDTIWDAAGDLAVGTGADTAARLAKGVAGSVLAMGNSAVTWNAGTSFPASKATEDRFWRTDLHQEFYWDGTRWVTTQLFRLQLGSLDAQITATGVTTDYEAAWGTAVFSDLWLVDVVWIGKITATNTGAAYWTLDLYKQLTAGGSDTVVASGTTQSLTASQNHVIRTVIGALAGNNVATFYSFATKVGAPSNIFVPAALSYRGVAT